MNKPYLHTRRKRLLSFINTSTLCNTASIFCWRVLLLTVTCLLLLTALRPILLTLLKGCSNPLPATDLVVFFCSKCLVTVLTGSSSNRKFGLIDISMRFLIHVASSPAYIIIIRPTHCFNTYNNITTFNTKTNITMEMTITTEMTSSHHLEKASVCNDEIKHMKYFTSK